MFDVRPFQDGYSPRQAAPVGEKTPWGYLASRPPAVFSMEGVKTIKAQDLTYALQTPDASQWTTFSAQSPSVGVYPVKVD